DSVAYTVSCKKLSDGLLVYYNFDELVDGKVLDASGNGNDGIVVGRVREAKGHVDGGLNLGGLDGCVQLPNISGLRSFTVSMWVKFNSSEDVAYQRIFDFGNDRHNYFTFAACGYVGGATNGNVATVAEKVYDFTPGKWYHYAVTVSDGVVTSYLNGVELSRNENFSFDLSALDGFVNNAIGRASINYSPYLNGVVDEFRLYNYALSAEQVKGLYGLVDVEQEYFE
ncbi:MAG: LamG domain-containing protein, partial [Candidatus Fimimonas sp.]